METLKTISTLQETKKAESFTAFENLYLQVREKEKRINTDEETAMLPSVSSQHLYFKEWKLRGYSFKKLVQYLKNKNRLLNILEVGCGNGWLSAGLAATVPGTITGIDINSSELEQAKRVFGEKENLKFLQGDIQNQFLPDNFFDIIVFAASVQYFPSLKRIIQTAQQHLHPVGEIHILDSPFYKRSELEGAKDRTRKHYSSLGFSEMSSYYFHHCIDELKNFKYEILYNPDSLFNKFRRIKNPFYMIKIIQS